jgi:hypothetical protein
LGCQIWLTSDDNDVVMAVTTMMVVVRFCKCSSRQQHDDREQEGLFHISIIAGVIGVQSIFTLAFITSWGYASRVSYNGSQLLPSSMRSSFRQPYYRAPLILDAKFPHDRKPMDKAGDKFQE